MTLPENPPAFPKSGPFNKDGMSLRDWFAGQALPQAFAYAALHHDDPIRDHLLPEEWAAQISYGLADAMLRERCK